MSIDIQKIRAETPGGEDGKSLAVFGRILDAATSA